VSRHVRTAILIKELRLERARTKLALDEAFEATQRHGAYPARPRPDC
jgi:hypothetical protein